MPPAPYALILDDHPLVARGMAEFLRALRPGMDMQTAAGVADAWECITQRGMPRLVLVDYWLADGAALAQVARLRAHCPSTTIAVVSGDDDPQMAERARLAGAHGFIHKQETPEVFDAAVQALLAGRSWYSTRPAAAQAPRGHEQPVTPGDLGLSVRQGEILALLLQGLPNKRIAQQYGLSESTVKEHVSAILLRMGARTRVEAITLLRGRRLVLPATQPP